MTPLDRLRPPDLWPEIERRAATPAPMPVRPRPRHLTTAAAIAVVVALIGVAAVLISDDGDDDVRATSAPTSTASTILTEGAALTCLDAGLALGSIPDDASTAPPVGATYVEGTQFRSWTEDGMAVLLQVPGTPFVGDINSVRHDFIDDRWTVFFEPPVVRLDTGYDECGYAVSVANDDEAAARALVERVARRLEWRADLGVTDCGPLSPQTVHTGAGPNVAAIFQDPIGPTDVMPDGTRHISAATRTVDGRCAINLLMNGGLEVEAIVSGSAAVGAFGLDSYRGFAPDGDKERPSEFDDGYGLGVSVRGTTFSVNLGYWCDECTVTRVSLGYPEARVSGSGTSTDPAEPVTGELSGVVPPGSYGVLTVTVEGPQHFDIRGIVVTVIPSGDFAAG